jgi:hypothetical protein
MMKLRIKNKTGLTLLQPSKLHYKVVRGESGLEWRETRENGSARQVYPREVEVRAGSHEIERVDSPFIRGGEPWLVLKGSRIGAAESYLRQLAEATRGTTNGVEVICE